MHLLDETEQGDKPIIKSVKYQSIYILNLFFELSGNMSPPCDTDSDSSATKAANRMLRMGNTLREKYQRRESLGVSTDSDDGHDILAQLPDGKEVCNHYKIKILRYFTS